MSRPTVTSAIVYGTLRSGFHNARLWEGCADSEMGWLAGYRLYEVEGAGFPIVQRDEESLYVPYVRVEILTWRSDDLAVEGIERLDWLESVPRLYRRIEVTAVTDNGRDRRGWLYVPSSQWLTEGVRLIESGDWAAADARSRV